MSQWYRAIYLLGNLKIKGHATEGPTGLCWFRQEEKLRINKNDLSAFEAGDAEGDLLVHPADLKILIETGKVIEHVY